MRYTYLLAVLVSLVAVLLVSNVGVTYSSFIDTENSTGNRFTGWTSTLWAQTTQADFNAGVSSNVDVATSPGDVKLASGVGSDWYNTSWTYRRAINIDHTKVTDVATPSTTYANFPLLVYATGLSNINSNGTDVRFTASNGITELPREIESYSGGNLYAWVKLTLTKDASDGTNDVIYMYYGNATATEPAPSSAYGSQNVWNTNYNAVWHLKENPAGTAPQIKDSTSNARDGTTVGSMPSGASVASKIGNGLQFDGSNDGVNTSNFSIGATFTLEGWAQFSSLPTAWQTIVQGGASANRDLTIYKNGSGTTSVDFYDGADNYFNTAISTSSYYHIASTYNGTTLTIYVNGSSIGTLSKSYSLSSGRASMGYSVGLTADYLSGYLDEVRISNVACSSSWILTEYNNQNSASSFCLVGSQVALTLYVTSGTLASQVLDTGTAGVRWNALFWDKTIPASTNVTFEVRASDTIFANNATSPSWTSAGGTSPVTSGLPSGRYKQWRATLTTSNSSNTPTLSEVRVYHY